MSKLKIHGYIACMQQQTRLELLGLWGAEIGTNHKMDTLSNQNSHKLIIGAD